MFPHRLPRVIEARDDVDLRLLLNQRTMTGVVKDTPEIAKKRASYLTGGDWRGLAVLKVAKGIREGLDDDVGKGTLYNVQVSIVERFPAERSYLAIKYIPGRSSCQHHPSYRW